MSHAHHMSFGAELVDGGVRFRLWAPKMDRMDIEIDGDRLPMHAESDGWYELSTQKAHAGSLYRFVLPDGLRIPDPASRFQPSDVHGPSEVIDATAYIWQNEDWRGRAWEECVLYELHVGAFTPAGTFRAAIDRLDHLVALGVTAIELMPIADFPGARNWGYDGVLLYAPDSSYGRPDDLKALVDAAHGKGLMVFLDVVYNHFGPDGNYLPLYAPIFKETQTPWGAVVNFDDQGSQTVRELIVDNAIYWTQEYQFDGLRLDAVHAIRDEGHEPILKTLAQRVRQAAGERRIHLLIENEENQTSWLVRERDGLPSLYTAQWNDDVHHVLHVAATRETAGYYADYAGDTKKLGCALAEGFAFQGEMMPYRDAPRGEPSAFLPPTAFVAFIQNHDQIGNRAFGERLTAIASKEAIQALAAIYLLLPQVPMLFMGEDWGAAQPFPFFCDFAADLSDAVREGRRAEFAKFPEFQNPDARAKIPDPTAAATFLSAKLNWDETDQAPHADWKRFYKQLLDIRHREIIPRLKGAKSMCYEVLGEEAILAAWTMGDGATLTLCANLKAEPLPNFEVPAGRRICTQGSSTPQQLEAWNVIWLLRGERGDHVDA